eukprot:jgi/Botrbrau1/20299/Bobra.31_1s0076.1
MAIDLAPALSNLHLDMSKRYRHSNKENRVPDSNISELLGECSARNLHTAIALLGKIRERGIEAGSEGLNVQPYAVVNRRRSRHLALEMAFWNWPPARRQAISWKGGRGWADLPPDLLWGISQHLSDRDIATAACTCALWRHVLSSCTTKMSFAWLASHPRPTQADKVVGGVASSFRFLREVSLRGAMHLSNAPLVRLARSCGSHLQVLEVGGCSKLTDAGLEGVARACPNLHSLNVNGCNLLTDAGFAAVGAACPRLTRLSACGCSLLSDVGLSALALSCRELQEVNVGWCERVGNRGVEALASSCRELRCLDLCGCRSVGNRAIVAVAILCCHLTSLTLHCCRKLTDSAMYGLAAGLRGLTHLNVSGCTNLHAEAVQEVVAANPGLHTCGPTCRTLLISGCLELLPVSCACGGALPASFR